MSEPERIRVFRSIPTYDDWCKENGLNSENDDNYGAYCEWRDNS